MAANTAKRPSTLSTRPVHGPESVRHSPKSSAWIRITKRKAIYLRDGSRCAYCGCTEGDNAQGKYVALTLDHIVPLSAGGTHDPKNLLTACHPCNSRRRDEDFRTFVGCAKQARRLRAQACRQLEPYLIEVALEQRVEQRIRELVAAGRLQWVAPDWAGDDTPF